MLTVGFAIICALSNLLHSSGEDLFRAGSPCDYNWECYSGVCYSTFKTVSFCAPDGPVNGSMAAGSACTANEQCFSKYCHNQICAPDSRVQGKVAAGGMCWHNGQCYSGLCMRRQCLAEAVDADARHANISLLPGGSDCEISEQCHSGFCHSFRCAPDERRRNVLPSGSTCVDDEQCSSKVCYANRCSPESHLPKGIGKVANGGRCRTHDQCHVHSECHDDICLIVTKIKHEYGGDDEADENDDDYYDIDDDEGRIIKARPGTHCVVDKDCDNSGPCAFGRCAPTSPANVSLIADGGRCTKDAQCASGQCHGDACSVSYAPGRVTGWVAAGSYCRDNRHCYSFLCVQEKCSPDSYSDEPRTRRPDGVELYANRVAAGGSCLTDSDCYSDLCTENFVCASDGPQIRSVASGGVCKTDSDCAGHYCYFKRCIVSDETAGRVAPGGRCRFSDDCAPGSMCVDEFCKRPKDFARRTLIPLRGVQVNGACWVDAQCALGRCLARKCRVPAYVGLGAHFEIEYIQILITFGLLMNGYF